MHARLWNPVTLYQTASETEAHIVAGMLIHEGIATRVVGGFLSGIPVDAPAQCSILVDTQDFSEAQKVLQSHQQHARMIDWNRIDVGEPLD